MKTTIANTARHSTSKSFIKLNPHLFGVSQPEPAKRIRQSTKPLCNALETEWGQEIAQSHPGVRPQSISLSLGNGIRYTPDWIDMTVHPVRVWECKGPHAFRGGFENLKVAARMYQEIKFTLVWKDEGQWKQQEILP